MKWLIRLPLAVLTLSAALYASLVGYNNRDLPPPTVTEIDRSWQMSIGWLREHRDRILDGNNPALWAMLRDAEALTHDPFLGELLKAYRDRYSIQGLWAGMLEPGTPHLLDPRLARSSGVLAGLDEYQRHLVYGSTCSTVLIPDEERDRYQREDFCTGKQRLRPACVTHQVIALRYQLRNRCPREAATRELIARLQVRIVAQLTWDPRRVDVYMQRVLVLAESGARDRIKPVWLRTLLDMQRPDGSWSGFDPRLPLDGERYLGFTQRGIGIGKPDSSFHTTAQGVLLMALLKTPLTS